MFDVLISVKFFSSVMRWFLILFLVGGLGFFVKTLLHGEMQIYLSTWSRYLNCKYVLDLYL